MSERQENIVKLLQDDRFLDWVLNEESIYKEYWKEWLEEDDENPSLFKEAKDILEDIRQHEMQQEKDISDAFADDIWQHIENKTRTNFKSPSFKKRLLYIPAAAISVGILLLASILFLNRPQSHLDSVNTKHLDSMASPELIRFNGSSNTEVVFLPDGSQITLMKGASVTYNRMLNGDKREVRLNGEAFFDIAKDSSKPFYIYTDKMVIRVLGTSFKVNGGNGDESVIVKSGKVSVYLKGQDLEKEAPQILLPNQACKYASDENELIAESDFDKDELLASMPVIKSYKFDDSPVETVLNKVEQMYMIPIKFQPENFKNCYITITLGQEGLENTMKVITKTIGASFTMSENGIYLEGKGCAL